MADTVRLRRATRFGSAVAALLASGALAMSAADGIAATYTVYTCRTPQGGAGDVSDWAVSGPAAPLAGWSSSCPSAPMTFWLDGAHQHPWDSITATFAAPQGTAIAGYTLWRSLQVAAGSWYAYAVGEQHGAQGTWRETCTGTAGCSGLGDPADPLGDANRVANTAAGGLTALTVSVACSSFSPSPCPATQATAISLQLHRADIVLQDDTAPQFSSPPSGPLVTAGVALSGTQPVSVQATDQGGGVYQLLFEVDGTIIQRSTIDDNHGQCAVPFTRAAPCPAKAAGSFALDTTRLADGPHRLRLLVTDATATNTTAWGPVTITTENQAPPGHSCDRTPVSSRAVARAQVGFTAHGHHARHSTTVAYGKRVRITGRLSSRDGSPIAGATLCVAGHDGFTGAPAKVYGHASTDASGRFQTTLQAGPTRIVWFVYRDGTGAASATVRVHVRSRVTLGLSRGHVHNRQRVRFRGRLPKPVPAHGVVVELKAWLGTHWGVFANARARRDGRFAKDYRFTRTSGPHSYRIRAVVPPQAAYPYSSGWSQPVTIHVRG
jgi:hypothetical protein